MLNEFKTFIIRGNMVDLAVGIVIGAAFTTVVNSFVERPADAAHRSAAGQGRLREPVRQSHRPAVSRPWPPPRPPARPTLNYGMFINNVINFLIVGFVVFLVVKQVNRMHGPAPAPPAATTRPCPHCAMDIPKAARRCPHCTSDLGAAR